MTELASLLARGSCKHALLTPLQNPSPGNAHLGGGVGIGSPSLDLVGSAGGAQLGLGLLKGGGLPGGLVCSISSAVVRIRRLALLSEDCSEGCTAQLQCLTFARQKEPAILLSLCMTIAFSRAEQSRAKIHTQTD